MKIWYSEETLFVYKELPHNYGTIKAKETINKIFSEFSKQEFNQKFVNGTLERENQESIELEYLDQLFE